MVFKYFKNRLNESNESKIKNELEYTKNILDMVHNYKDVVNENESFELATKKNEEILMIIHGVVLLEMKKMPGSYEGGSTGVSFRLTDRISVRSSKFSGRFIPGPEIQAVVDSGKFIITSLRGYEVKSKNIFTGKNYLILSRDILKEKYTLKKNNQNLIFLSGSEKLDYSILDNLKKNNKKIHLIIGPLVSKSEIENLRKRKIQFSIDPEDIFRKIKISKDIYCKFGLSTLEIISLNKKPVVIIKNESSSRMRDIIVLFKLGLIKLLFNNNLVSKKKKISLDINLSLKNIIKVINLK
jgi:hypothetical protein